MKAINRIIARIEYRVRRLSPRRIAGRLKGPRILANSIPKAGTHLLMRCLILFPEITYTGIHYTKGTADRDQLEGVLRNTGKGCFSAAHLCWSEDCSMLLKEYAFKTILMVRDPRDVVISGVYFVMQRKKHHLHEYFCRLPDMNARVTAFIGGVDASESSRGVELENVGDNFGKYVRWIDETYNLLVLYERLIGSNGGGDSATQIEEIRRISKHLDQPLSPEQIASVARKTFSPRSLTFRKGLWGQWTRYFNEDHKKAFKDLAGHFLITFGYEKDNDW